MSEQGKTQIQTLGAGFIGFVGVVGLGSLVIMHHGTAPAASAVAYAPVDAASALAVPAATIRANPALSGAPTGQSGAVPSSPAPLLSADDRAAVPDAPPSAAPAATATAGVPAAAPKLVVGQHLDAASSASSSAQASASTAAPAPKKLVPAKKPFFAPKLDLTKNQGTIASTVHYGVSDRSELMGRAAGPVYNFSGKGAGGQGAAVAAGSMDANGAMQAVNAAQAQVDASAANGAQKAQLDQNLNQVRQTVTGSSSPQ
jgi:hypothetical protein